MYPVSAEFRRSIANSARSISKCEVMSEGQVVGTIPFIGGQVSVEAQRSTRRTLGISFAADDLVPSDSTDLLYPSGNELKVSRGIRLPSGPDEYVPLGVFTFDTVTVNEDSGGVSIELSGFDRSETVRRNVWTEPYVVDKDTLAADAIAEILAERASSLPELVRLGSTDVVTPQIVYQPGQDPWEACASIAAASGMQVYFDPNGVPTLDDITAPNTSNAVATFNLDDTESDHPIVTLNRELSSAETFNGVIALGEGTDLVRPLRAERWDENPSSPFYYLGPYGKKPFLYSSPLILTDQQAQAAAETWLAKVAGTTEQVTWTGVVNPAYEVYDVFTLARSAVGADNTFIVDSLNIPLSADSGMSATGRTTLGVAI